MAQVFVFMSTILPFFISNGSGKNTDILGRISVSFTRFRLNSYEESVPVPTKQRHTIEKYTIQSQLFPVNYNSRSPISIVCSANMWPPDDMCYQHWVSVIIVTKGHYGDGYNLITAPQHAILYYTNFTAYRCKVESKWSIYNLKCH